MVNKTVVLDGDCQLIIPQDGELGVISAIRKPYPSYTGETTVTPSDSTQVLNTELTTVTKNITVNPVPSDYVGSDIPRRDDEDLTASGATVTAPAGYYEEAASKNVQSGTEGTPVASKGEVSNHAVSVTPSVTNTEGYISGGTKTGTAVTVSASELVSGTKSIVENGEGIDVANYATVDVDVPSGEPTLQTITKTYTPSTSQQTEEVTASAGYDGIEEVDITVNAMPTGTEGTPTASKGTVSNHSVAVTPSVTNSAGYISGGTKTGTPVTVSASELVSGSQTVTNNGTVDVTNLASLTVNVGEPEMGEKTVTANGVYNASADNLDGYSKVTVTVPASAVDSGTKAISTNGTHDVIGYASASVAVPASEVDSGTKSITQNGSGQDVVGYAAVDVNVPNSYAASDEGKVVSSGALVAQSSASYSANGTYDTTLINEVEVAVAPVNIQPLSVTENGIYDAPSGVDGYSPVTVNVQAGGFSMDDVAQRTFSVAYGANASTIASYAFYYNTSITAASFPSATRVGSYAFFNCTSLTTVSFPIVSDLSAYAFSYCTYLSGASFPEATYIGAGAFYSCFRLKTIDLPKTITVAQSAFYNCSSLTTANLPKVKSIGTNAFYSCKNLQEMNLPELKTLEGGAFAQCSSLTAVSMPLVSTIYQNVFSKCFNLISLYLYVSSIPNLSNSNAFSSTPIAGYSASAGQFGSIYVPASLYSSFQTASNWSFFAIRMVSV